jgi:hypothetical protein
MDATGDGWRTLPGVAGTYTLPQREKKFFPQKISKKGGSFSEASPLGLGAASCFSAVGSNRTEIFLTSVHLQAFLSMKQRTPPDFLEKGRIRPSLLEALICLV